MKRLICVAGLLAGIACGSEPEAPGPAGRLDPPAGPLNAQITIADVESYIYTNAYFEFPDEPTGGCVEHFRAGCKISVCDATPFEQLNQVGSAGVVRTVLENGTIELPPRSIGRYVQTEAELSLSTGEMVRVEAEGREVPAFSTTLTAPAAVQADGLWIAREVDVALPIEARWTSSAPGELRIGLSSSFSDGRSVFAECTYDAAANRALIPNEVILELHAPSAFAILKTVSSEELIVGDWELTVSVERITSLKNVIFDF